MTRRRFVEAASLVLLRMLIGWHFLYEGLYKLLLPGWSADGTPLARWSASGYLAASTGPLASWFRELGASGAAGWIDILVPVVLALVGLSLILGLFTTLGTLGALLLLSAFYLAAIPTAGVPQPGAEGTYLFVNKTLIEWGAVLVLLCFRTGEIAGLDVLRGRRRRPAAEPLPA